MLLGLGEKGSHVWDIELQAKDDSVKLPSANTEHVNTYEICGTLEMYLENNIAYGCINVSEITPVEGVLKVDEENSFSPVVNPFS